MVDIKRLDLASLRRVSVLRRTPHAANGMALGHDGRAARLRAGHFELPAAIARVDRATGERETRRRPRR